MAGGKRKRTNERTSITRGASLSGTVTLTDWFCHAIGFIIIPLEDKHFEFPVGRRLVEHPAVDRVPC